MSYQHQMVVFLAGLLICSGLDLHEAGSSIDLLQTPESGIGIGIGFFEEEALPPPAASAMGVRSGSAVPQSVATLQVPTQVSTNFDADLTSQETKRRQAEHALQDTPIASDMKVSQLVSLFTAGAQAVMQNVKDISATSADDSGGDVNAIPDTLQQQQQQQQIPQQESAEKPVSSRNGEFLAHAATLTQTDSASSPVVPAEVEQPWRDAPNLSPGASVLLTALGRSLAKIG
eukprot:TRINITY_DN988_c0_g1_i1.p1 TRINITY_DN988_c0_g1~~TRINITY_DN988_c0_g1_i1.p1  ORF type:complete len:231 (-),score=51.22 TRINITY_DN988_c0_g1_i1:65-757(-)